MREPKPTYCQFLSAASAYLPSSVDRDCMNRRHFRNVATLQPGANFESFDHFLCDAQFVGLLRTERAAKKSQTPDATLRIPLSASTIWKNFNFLSWHAA
jgi:hypothetical protein